MNSHQISQAILAKVAAGLTVSEAYDAVFGDGAYAALAGMIYDELKAKAA